MQVTEQRNRENVGACWPEQYGSFDLVALDPISLLHEGDAVAMNGVRDFMAEGSGQLLGVLHEIEQRIHDINITAWRGEGIRLALVDEVEFKGMGVARLSHPRDRVRYRFQGLVEGGGLDDLPLVLQLVVYLLPELGLLIGGLRHRSLTSTDDKHCQQERRDPNSGLQGLQPRHGESHSHRSH